MATPKDNNQIVTADDVKDKPTKPNSPQASPKSDSASHEGGQEKKEDLLEVDGRIIPDAGVPTDYREGVLDTQPKGHGFLRPNYTPTREDIYISNSQIRRFKLREGDLVGGQVREPKENERYHGLLKVEKINGKNLNEVGDRPWFDKLTPVYPQPQIKLETETDKLTTRMMDLVAPIGFGQRGMIVSPPKAGKTWLLKDMAEGISANHPDVHLMAVLIAERPEEVTDIRRSVKGEVIASNFDENPRQQTRAAEMALARAKRLVEMGKDVFILLDSITRLARAYNLVTPTSGRTLSGGFDPAALSPAKQFLGAARKIENDGSLTIIGTALVQTDSRMDDLIYEEFKGTGNMELHLDRGLAERRIFPAIDIQRSGTRKEELLFGNDRMKAVQRMRRMIDLLGEEERTEAFVQKLEKTKSNEDFLTEILEASEL